MVKALKTIEQRAHDPEFTTEELAKICGVSSRTIGRLFEQHRLRSPYQVLLNVRVNSTAQRMLQESELTADEIAFRCGFADYSSFYRVFKNQVGISPSDFGSALASVQAVFKWRQQTSILAMATTGASVAGGLRAMDHARLAVSVFAMVTAVTAMAGNARGNFNEQCTADRHFRSLLDWLFAPREARGGILADTMRVSLLTNDFFSWSIWGDD